MHPMLPPPGSATERSYCCRSCHWHCHCCYHCCCYYCRCYHCDCSDLLSKNSSLEVGSIKIALQGAAAIEYIPATSRNRFIWHHQYTLTTLFNFIYLFTIATLTNCSVIAIAVAVAIVVVTVDVIVAIVVVTIAVVAIVDITATAQSIHHLRWAAPKKLSWSSQTLCETMAANMVAWSMNRYI